MGHDPYIQVPSMKNTAFSFSTSYILNRNYSFKNLIYQTEWQKHSAGSLVPSLYYDLNKYYFDLYGTQSSQRDYNIRAAIGYYYTFIIHKNFFIAPSIVPSAGIRLSREATTKSGQTETSHRNYFTQYLDGGLKLGFSSNRFIAGCGLNFSANWYRNESSNRIENDKTYGILYFGYRFGTPKIIQKGYNYFDDKLNQ